LEEEWREERNFLKISKFFTKFTKNSEFAGTVGAVGTYPDIFHILTWLADEFINDPALVKSPNYRMVGKLVSFLCIHKLVRWEEAENRCATEHFEDISIETALLQSPTRDKPRSS
jgi:hypothetical protein